LWLIKVWFSASTFVVKIATFAKPQNVACNRMTTVLNINVCTDEKRQNANPSQKLKEVQPTAQSQRYCTTFNFAPTLPSPPTTPK
jgi:hypothetical protein